MNLVYRWYRISNKLYKKNIPIIPKLIKVIIRIVFSAVIPYEVEIGENTILGYNALGVVIHKKAKIGRKCIISQNVTIGGAQGCNELPVIGDYVDIGAGAQIIGNVKIGDYAIIGAGAVVTKDIPKNATAVGVPARILKKYRGL